MSSVNQHPVRLDAGNGRETTHLQNREAQRISLFQDDSAISRPQPIPSADSVDGHEKGKLFDGENTPQNIATYGFGLGILAGFSVALAATGATYSQMWLFLVCLAVFHFLEYLATALFNAPKLSLDCKWIKNIKDQRNQFFSILNHLIIAFLINHSAHYHAAHLAGLTEFLVEAYFFPSWKSFGLINWIGTVLSMIFIEGKTSPVDTSFLGFILMLSGQAARTIAMFSAKANFSHFIVSYKAPNHVLVTNGIYALMRHPSYFGFYWWAIGAQVLLMNPICFALFIYWLHRFFSERIQYEEHTLSRFFGQEWETYKKKTPTLMPLIA
jgi:protein-S-isoprenylcysteine O-methyltransferase